LDKGWIAGNLVNDLAGRAGRPHYNALLLHPTAYCIHVLPSNAETSCDLVVIQWTRSFEDPDDALLNSCH
jgi:hypothetical protein